jgi:putative ABC transport system permease protein
VIVLTHELWNRLGADPGIVGTDVRLNGQPYAVIGVMPPDFAFVRNASLGPAQHADAYTTFSVNLGETNPGSGCYGGVIRVPRGTSPKTVTAAVDAVGRTVDARDFRSRGLKLYPVGLKADPISGVRPALLVLGSAGVFLLLALMVNLASVLLARAAQREHEFAVSRALGANAVAFVRATVFEGGVLGLIGGGAGALVAIWGTRMLVALAPLELPRREAVAVDWSIGVVVIGLGVLLGLLAAAVPATWVARVSLSSLLAASAVGGGGGHGRMRRGLVVTQVALSLVLLNAGGLVVRSFERLLRADPGFAPGGILTVHVPMRPKMFPKSAEALTMQERLQDALAAIPGVTGVSARPPSRSEAAGLRTRSRFRALPGTSRITIETRRWSMSSARVRDTSRLWACGYAPAPRSTMGGTIICVKL